ncbi:MAG: precorrin-8X methylmutase [Rhodospirillaceae bacterium]|nr:precorrin-8X methylmutase [Rhodospirillaceae bacterium]MBT4939372.1 precorrin-8X methylmutase [Rhodospirillaceae bacterium]MBT5941225.1 precorrin-8X methylmutase [Rhodospirillaceae bacterium]
MSYLRDPAEIYRESFAAIAREVDLSGFPDSLHKIVLRLVHSIAIPEIVEDIAWDGDVAGAAKDALAKGAPIIVDANMVVAGIMKDRLSNGSEIKCFLRDESVPELAQSLATTRSAAAVELWRPELEGAIISIGNAPTALFHLIDMLADKDCPRPAAIFAFPVGFIGAAESKAYLIEKELGIPFITLKGRMGGSALAAATVNAVLIGDSS